MKLRKAHSVIGVIMAFWILNAAVTGAMRANAAALYWKNRPSRDALPALPLPALGMDELYGIVERETAGKDLEVRHVELKPLLDKAVYVVRQEFEGKSSYTLVDAKTGEVLSPLAPDTAQRIAEGYVPEGTAVKQFEYLEAYWARKAKQARPVYRVLFEDSLGTEIFVDRETGEVPTVLDKGRRFGLWMVKLHELDFAGLRRPASTALGLGTVLITLTGLILAFKSARNSKKRGAGR